MPRADSSMKLEGANRRSTKYQKEKCSHGGHGVHGVIDRYRALFCCLEWMKHGLKPTSSGRSTAKKSSVSPWPPCEIGFQSPAAQSGACPQFAVLKPGL